MKLFPRHLTAITLICLCLTTPAVLAKVDVTGLETAAKDNVLLTLALAKEPCDAPEWKIRGLFAGADQEIDQALRALGYYHAVSKNALSFNKDCWQADFAVTPGPQVLVTDVAITISGDADHDAEFAMLRNKLITATGNPLRHDAYEKMKSQLESLAMARGYLDAEFSEKQLLIDKANNTARINLVFAT
ncbi:MAG: POTRA domain-containing protein, partial [Methylococcaceae bacterium]|nr:POTRA domain-containing protein [Methylococcaceae bacterium]